MNLGPSTRLHGRVDNRDVGARFENAQANVGCRCRPSICRNVPRAPQGVRSARTSLRTGSGSLTGASNPRRKRKTFTSSEHDFYQLCEALTLDLRIRGRYGNRRLGAKALVSLNPVREARFWRPRSISTSQDGESAASPEDLLRLPEARWWEPGRAVPEARHETPDAGQARSTLFQAQRIKGCARGESVSRTPQGGRSWRQDLISPKLVVRIVTPLAPLPWRDPEGRDRETYDKANMRDQ